MVSNKLRAKDYVKASALPIAALLTVVQASASSAIKGITMP